MINLFNTNQYIIETSKYSNLLHDKIVRTFEEEFCRYVGAEYGCSVNSASSAIFMLSSIIGKQKYTIPSILPPVVLNALLLGGNEVTFNDNTMWVGDSYILLKMPDFNIIDSAQKVERNQCKWSDNRKDITIFSFYPTKPVGSCDGGIIVSNNKDIIDEFRIMSMNGMTANINNWERTILKPGYKMYMNSIQAQLASNNLKMLDRKKEQLYKIREIYNDRFGLKNTSDHLYRINVKDNLDMLNKANYKDIVCGVHYKSLANIPIYSYLKTEELPNSDLEEKTTLSIPFHENLTLEGVDYVCKFINENN